MVYFSIAELVRSPRATQLGINNNATGEYKKNLEALVDNLLDPVRSAWGTPINVTSGFRCKELNEAVHGAYKSQHLAGEAADIVSGGNKVGLKFNYELGVLIASMGNFDQLIFEDCGRDNLLPQWIHVSFSRTKNRRNIMKMVGGVYSNITLADLGLGMSQSKGKTIDDVSPKGKKGAPSKGKKGGINTSVL